MPDKFGDAQPNLLSAPVSCDYYATIAGDTTLNFTSREVTVATPGDLNVLMADGTTRLIPSAVWAVAPVQVMRITKIFVSGTTAQAILVKP